MISEGGRPEVTQAPVLYGDLRMYDFCFGSIGSVGVIGAVGKVRRKIFMRRRGFYMPFHPKTGKPGISLKGTSIALASPGKSPAARRSRAGIRASAFASHKNRGNFSFQ